MEVIARGTPVVIVKSLVFVIPPSVYETLIVPVPATVGAVNVVPVMTP